MTAEALLAILAERGLCVVAHQGRPLLLGPPGERTDTVCRVVFRRASEIMQALGEAFVPWERPPLLLRPEYSARPDDALRAATVALAGACPACKQGPWARGVCWNQKCYFRPCTECGKGTGSPFIATCLTCDFREAPQRIEVPEDCDLMRAIAFMKREWRERHHGSQEEESHERAEANP